MKRQLFRFAFFLLICLTFPLSTTAQGVDILDTNLRAAIEAELGKASGDSITASEMATLTRLEASDADIRNLTGLEHATSLTGLYLANNSITDISPLSGLTNLIDMGLERNSISDISAVAGLTNLNGLYLSSNSISDISVVVSLTNLKWLYLPDNSISDISAVSGLTNLTRLSLWDNAITDISALSGLTNLTELALGGNLISDISAVSGLTNLMDLHLPGNSIVDLSPLVANTGFGEGDKVNVWGNPLSDASINTHIPTLEGRGVTVEFDFPLDIVQAVDIPDANLRGAIEAELGKASGDTITTADMANLTGLHAPNANISDLTGLEHATNLKWLWLDGEEVRPGVWENSNSVSDLSPLAGLTQLESLDLWQNSVSDISALAGLTNLTHLGVVGNNISDVSVLAGLISLESLWLDDNPLSDISALAGLTQLTRLGLDNTSISDISTLAGLTNLTWARMERNNISDVSPLVANTGLGAGDEVHVRGNPLNRASIETHIPALKRRGVAVEFDNVITELVNIPDDNLRAKIADALGKASDALITTADMERLSELRARNADISNLTGLESATNLTRLDLGTEYVEGTGWINSNSVSDLSPLAGLTNLSFLNLAGNSVSDISTLAGLTNLSFLNLNSNAISDISPLVANMGLGARDFVGGWGNPLSEASTNTHIPALQSRGVEVDFIRTPTLLLKISGTVAESDNLLIVEVRDNRNRPLAGVSVTFTVISGGGTLSATNAMTGTNGRAESRLTLGPEMVTNRVSASVEGISESVTFSDVSELPVPLPDSNLRAAIEAQLDKASGDPITPSDMARLTDLFAQNSNITNLTGLEGATNLTSLYLGAEYVEAEGRSINSNSVSDLSPLSGLTNLRHLALDSNNISDISAVAGLTNLESLRLDDNSISDISPVAGLTNLTDVDLGSNTIADISAVAGLTNLTFLVLWDNSISDISPVKGLTNLRFLLLRDNSISDISTVAGLTNLEFLILEDNSISDISAVAGLTNLTSLSLGNNSISDISAVAGLTNLEFLILEDNSISDISAVAGLTNLTFLLLGDNAIVDLSPLVENTGLGAEDWVDVERNPLSFASIYTHIPALQSRAAGVAFDPQQPDLLSGHTDGVVSVAFSRDGTLASGGRDGTVILWADESVTTLTAHTASARSVAFSPDGSILASGSHDGTVILWDAVTGQPTTLTEHTAGVETVAFTRDGSTLASGSHNGTIILWNVANGQPKYTITGHANRVWSLAFSPDGTLAIGRDDGTILLWDVANERPKYTLIGGHTAFVESVAFNRDGSTLASGSADNTVILWEVATGRPIAILLGHTAGVNSVAFNPAGTLLASGSDDSTVRLWDAVTGQPIATLTGHMSWVRSVAFSPDGATLASGSGDTTVRLWEIPAPALPEYTLSIPKGLNLIHVPLQVTEVDGAAQPIESISDLYHALGGASTVLYLITYDFQAQKWRSYFGASDTGTPADRVLTDEPEMGIIASLLAPTSVHLRGDALGTNGSSTITLNPGLNVVGLPLNDSRIKRVSDLFALDGIGGNVLGIIFTDGGEFKLVGRAGDPGDIEITGGQAFIMHASQEAAVNISGDAWTNGSGTAAAPPVTLKGIEVGDTTPVLGLRGSIASEGTNANQAGFRVTVKNLSTDKKLATATLDDEMGYRLTVVDIETGRAATVGDILEIAAQSPNPFIGVEPFRYTVTAEDVKRSLIQLPELVAYEIPAETQLLANYPNPFNPETWIPYRLAEDASVTLTIYDGTGQIVRTISVGHQVAAVYESQSKAIYWDGRNDLGEQVASGVYFYTLTVRSETKVGDFSATRKMLILK